MRLQPLFLKILLVESTKAHFFLMPTKITFSSYNWVKAPTSTCTDFNMYKEDNMFFLAPPYHPCFSYLNLFSTICRQTYIPIHTNSIMIYFWSCLCTFVPLIVSVMDILERAQSPLSLCNPHFDSDPCTNSLSAESATIHSSCISFYKCQSINPLPICIPDGPFP